MTIQTENNNSMEMTTVAPAESPKANNKVFTHGKTTYLYRGQKWHFTTELSDGKTHTFIVRIRGGFAVASRIAPLVDKDVVKFGHLAGQRANINRLVEAAR